MVSKKGQGMSINVIIIAALALVVLVVLVVIFMSKSTSFEQTVGKQSQTELIKMQIQYGDCRPGVEAENTFKVDYGKAAADLEKEQAKITFTQEINRCKGVNDENGCKSANCLWS